MQTSQESQAPASILSFYNQPTQQNGPYGFQTFQVLNNDSSGSRSRGTEVSFQACNEQFFTLESTPATNFAAYNSPAVSISSNLSPFSPQYSHSGASE
ncbi:hypothetical protein ABTG41_18560, partial [Acinetobacter baumannii]